MAQLMTHEVRVLLTGKRFLDNTEFSFSTYMLYTLQDEPVILLHGSCRD